MRVVHWLDRFSPRPGGGIHVHLVDLDPHLRARGAETAVLAPDPEGRGRTFEQGGIPVLLYGDGGAGCDDVARWLRAQEPAVVGLHRWNEVCGPRELQVAKGLGLPTVVHVHLAEPLCTRGTMLRSGQSPCGGPPSIDACRACLAAEPAVRPSHQRLARRLAHGEATLGPADLDGSAQRLRALLGRQLRGAGSARVERKFQQLEQLRTQADCVVALSSWTRDALVRSGVPAERVHLVPAGTAPAPALGAHPAGAGGPGPARDGVLRVGFVGRLHPSKGPHILLAALARIPREVPIQLVLHTLPAGERYGREVERAAAADPRVVLAPPFTREEQDEAYAGLDVVAIPSQCLETGPLVALEAQAHGLPVVASRLGGLVERVRDGVDGLLLPHADPAAWATALTALAEEPGLRARLRHGVRPPRTLADEADELVALYRSLLGALRGTRP